MEPSPELYVRIAPRPGDAFDAPVDQINWSEAQVAFPADAAPVLSVGQSVDLGFHGPRVQGEARVRGFVLLRTEVGDQRVYRFQLDRADGAAFDAAVNRRAAFRVTPDPGEPVRVVVRADDGSGPRVFALLRDISESGLSFLVGKEDEWTLCTLQRLRLELRLPGVDRRLCFWGNVRYRRLERPAVQYGIRFEAEEASFRDAQAAVRAYVEARRRAMLERIDGARPAA
ncbi:MAG: PilZ domain-containing protein [Planctomycetota bacterium]